MSEDPTAEATAEATAADAGAETATEATQSDRERIPHDTAETDGSGDPGDGDTFPRAVVEKLRKESAGLRDRAKTAEEQVTALQRQIVSRQVAAAGVKPEAVFAVAQIDDLLADDGTVDPDKVSAAMFNARKTLGAHPKRNPAGRGGLHSGAGISGGQPAGFESAFRPREK
jgi:hypothetical protein